MQGRENYRIIKNDGVQVLVPYEPENKLFEKLKEEALENGVTAKWMHEAAKLCVTAYANDDFSRYAEQLYLRESGMRAGSHPAIGCFAGREIIIWIRGCS